MCSLGWNWDSKWLVEMTMPFLYVMNKLSQSLTKYIHPLLHTVIGDATWLHTHAIMHHPGYYMWDLQHYSRIQSNASSLGTRARVVFSMHVPSSTIKSLGMRPHWQTQAVWSLQVLKVLWLRLHSLFTKSIIFTTCTWCWPLANLTTISPLHPHIPSSYTPPSLYTCLTPSPSHTLTHHYTALTPSHTHTDHTSYTHTVWLHVYVRMV